MSVAGILDARGKIASNLLPDYIPNDLVAPVIFQAEAPATAGNPVIYVEGNAASAVGGSLALVPGSRTGAAAPDAGLTIVAQPTGVSVYVGTNGQATNLLSVAGASGLSRVYDGAYNQPVDLVPITIGVANFPPQAGNTGEIFRSTSFTGALQQNQQIQVPKTGWYMMQSEVRVGGAGITLPGCPITTPGVDIPGSLSITLYTGVVGLPYGGQCISAFSLYNRSDTDIDSYVFQNVLYLTAATNYSLNVIGAPTSGWNLGANGQIKVELISMNQ